MRRLVIALVVLSVMASTMVIGPGMPLGTSAVAPGISEASAQQPPIGGPTYCGPWQLAWYVSYSEYWYFWFWRWCYNPSLPPSETVGGGWYVDYASWRWGSYAGPGVPPGFQYNAPYS